MTEHIPLTHTGIQINGVTVAMVDPHITPEGAKHRVYVFAKEFDTSAEAVAWALGNFNHKKETDK